MVPSVVLIGLVVLAAAVLAAVKFGGTWLRFRGARVVTCPETKAPAGVEVDAAHAAATALHPELRLKTCSRWPERQDCGQACVAQIEASPEDCLVRQILTRWYQGKSCVYCGTAFGPVNWAEQKPGLLAAGGKLLGWSELRAEEVPVVIESAHPVCFSCYTATRLALDHPETVVDRSR